MDHLGDDVLKALTLGKLTTAHSLTAQRHLYRCPDCLKRLIAAELALAMMDASAPAAALKPDLSKPLYMRHDTADGFIYARVERAGRRWVERHWGKQLAGERECATMHEANEHALAAFREMFPEHRCTCRCSIDPEQGVSRVRRRR